MIRCDDVRKTYRTGGRVVEALRGASFRIDQPDFYAIMGASGSGKSTLLHLLAGIDAPDSGELEVAGHRVETMNDRALVEYRRSAVGIVFQQFNLIATMTAIENVMLPALIAGRPAAQYRERAAQLLDSLGLAPRTDHRPEALSGGEQQRVAIARALLFEPPVLLADEPTGALDSQASANLWALLADLAQRHNTTVVMVTHEPEAAAHCSRVFVLRDGVVVGIIEKEAIHDGHLAAEYQRLCRA